MHKRIPAFLLKLGMAQIVLGPSNFSTTGAARVAYSLGVHDPALGKMALRGILSSKSESNLRLHSSVGDSDDVASNGYPRRAASTRSRTNSGRMLMPQEIEHPWDWEPVRLVNRMLGSDSREDASNERLLQLRLDVTSMGSFVELQNALRRWPGTACALAAVGLAGIGRNVQLVAAYREAYGTKDALVARTRPKSNGGVGPLHTFKAETFTTAVLIEPVIEHLLKYQPEPSVMLELQVPEESVDFGSSAFESEASVALAERFCGVLAGLAPASTDCGATASCLLAKELMCRHQKVADMQIAGGKVLHPQQEFAIRVR
eukprot:g16814.t1